MLVGKRFRAAASALDVPATRDGKQLTTAGLVLVRQRPGSALGVLFIIIKDEPDLANIVVWPDLFERQRRVVLSASMIAVAGLVQREGEVVHVFARTLAVLSSLLRSVGERDEASLPPGRADRVKQASSQPTADYTVGSEGWAIS